MKNTSLLSKIVNITTIIVMLILVVLTGLLVGVRLFGFMPHTINNNTMEPAYKKGSIVYIKDSSFEDIKIKDSITYLLDEDLSVNTHRVLEKDVETELFITKGDANKEEDEKPVHYNNVLGTVKYSLPYLGTLLVLIGSKKGFISVLSVTAIILIISLTQLFLEVKNKRFKRYRHKNR